MAWPQGQFGRFEEAIKNQQKAIEISLLGCGYFSILRLAKTARPLDWREKGYKEQDTWCWGLKVDPAFDPLRTESRFQALRKKMDLDK